ncbi:MAG TPA: DsbA family protein [Candidatus Paceibacterota bacterium]|nr:DsbA family protein [Candidatus Paceibacterota bacterium]
MELNSSAGSVGKSLWNDMSFSVPVSIIAAGLMVAGSILYTGGSVGGPGTGTAALGDLPQEEQVVFDGDLTDNDPVIGNPDAPVTIVEFSDFQCPFCRSFFNDTYSLIKSEYIDTGKAKLVYRDFPLQFHDAARPSALAAECANEQGRFWEYHDKMFLEQAKQGNGTVTYGNAELKRWAAEIGLNTGQFNQCLDSEKYGDEVDADFEAGQAAGVSGTPSFFVNGKLLVGAQPFSAFQQAIDAEL